MTEREDAERERVRERLRRDAEERRRIIAERGTPVARPEKYADPIGFTREGEPLPASRGRAAVGEPGEPGAPEADEDTEQSTDED